MTETHAETSLSGASASVAAVFDEREDAVRAVRRLQDAGVSESAIRFTEGVEGGATGTVRETDRGFFEALGDFFFPEEDRYAYAEGLSRGGYLVTVMVRDEAERDLALDILDDEGTVDIEARQEEWRAEGWSGYVGAGSGGASGSQAAAAGFAEDRSRFEGGSRTLDADETIPVVEERVRVGKRDASHGRVRVRSYVVETPVREDVALTEERVEVERRPVDRAVAPGEDPFRERVVEAEERREEAVVSKEARVVEEVGLRREQDVRHETIDEVERRTEVEVEDERLDRTRDDVVR